VSAASPPGGVITIASKTVSRLGLGTLRLTGPGCWGTSTRPVDAECVLRRAIDTHGLTHIDTADAYGPAVAEELIRRALHPYLPEILIATKVGMIRPGPDLWRPLGRPDYLRAAVEASLRRLDVETLDLCYLHRIDPTVPLADQVGTLAYMVTEGKIAHIGLSKVSPEQIAAATATVQIAAVQNCLSIAEPDDPALAVCSERGIPYVAYRPLDVGRLPVGKALTWLLNLSPLVAAIPGTSNPEHLDQLVEALRKGEI
jgi:pyridoxine 4-dehydrogenase